jgi:hypothetical protein
MGDSDTKEDELPKESGVKKVVRGIGKALLPAPGAVAIASRPFLQSSQNKLIRFGGKLYDIRYTREDIDRRIDFFQNGKGALSEPEKDLLHHAGLEDIDHLESQLSETDIGQLPDFFMALQQCQTSASLSLSAKCYQPHSIISKVLQHYAKQDQETHEADMKKSLPSLDWMAAVSSRFNGLLGRVSSPAVIDGINKLATPFITNDDMVDLFTLRV